MENTNRNRDIDFDYLSNDDIVELAKPRNKLEEDILKDALAKLGDYTTAKKMANYMELSERSIRRYIDDRKLVTFTTGTRRKIYTRTILNIINLSE